MIGNSNSIQTGTIFITGIPASGKTTLGKLLEEFLLKSGINKVKAIDGEEFRKTLVKTGKCYGYSRDERKKVALEIARIALTYNQEGFICIICAICHVKEIRQQMRQIIGNVTEVYLDCPVSVCIQRDYKGNYRKALQGSYENFIGITESYELSDNPELVLDTATNTIGESLQVLSEHVINFLNKGLEV